jgi:hypothetical protein
MDIIEETFEGKMERWFIPALEEMRAKELHHLEFLKRHKWHKADVKQFINECKEQIKFLDLRIVQYREYIKNSQQPTVKVSDTTKVD